MSRYSSRSLDVGSTRYDSGSTYKGLDSSGLGSYRSSNLSGYGSHGYSSRSDRSSYSSSTSSTSTGLGSSRLHGSYSTRSAVADSVPLPRSSSFGRSEVLSSSTPRDQVDKGSYSSSLGRSSSIPTHSEEIRGSRYSPRSSALTSNHSLDSNTDAATERRLRLAERRRQREERGWSETSSDTSKEPSVERASSLRRDSDSDSVGTMNSARARRLARLQESSLTEEVESKESSPDVGESALRRANTRMRGTSSEDSTTSESPLVSETRASLRQRRQQEATETGDNTSLHSQNSQETDRSVLISAEVRRARRQRRLDGLDATSKQSGSQDEERERNSPSLVSSTTSRSWRERLQEEVISTGPPSEADDSRSRRQRSQEENQPVASNDMEDSHTEGRRRSQDKGQEEVSGRRSWLGTEGSVEEGVRATEGVQGRAERMARYKEERRKQMAHIANITSTAEAEDKEPKAVPSLFMSAKKDKKEPPSDSGGQETTAAPSDSAGGVTLMSRLRALRSDDLESAEISDKSQVNVDTAQTSVATHGTHSETSSTELASGAFVNLVTTSTDSKSNSSSVGIIADRTSSSSKLQSVPSSQSSQSSSQTSTTQKSPTSSDLSRLRKSPSPSSSRKSLTVAGTASVSSTTTSVSGTKPVTGFREPSPRKTSAVSSEVRSATRKSKSPSPVTSRLMAATKSSAAKGVQSSSTGTTSPRSSASPRGSPVPSDKHGVVRPASVASSTKGLPKIKPSLMPEHGSQDSSASHASKSVANEGKNEEGVTGSKYLVRFSGSQQTDSHKSSDRGTRQKDRESLQRLAGNEVKVPTSFSAASSTFSTDRDSGVGSSRLSSSSFTSTTDKDTAATKISPFAKTSRLKRTARVEVSSSSSREGSEEKQLPTQSVEVPAQQFNISSVKRIASMPSRIVSGDGLRAEDRKPYSSCVRKESSPPKDFPSSLKSKKEGGKNEAVGGSTQGQRQSTTTTAESSKLSSPSSPSGALALDDLLVKNAEYLSEDEDSSGGRKAERKLRAGEEPKLRRSLRKKMMHKSGIGSRSRGTPDRESRDGGLREEGMEVAADVTATVTLPTTQPLHSVVKEGEVICISPSPQQQHPDTPHPSDAAAAGRLSSFDLSTQQQASKEEKRQKHDADKRKDARYKEKGSEAEEGSGSRSKEATPDSDSVFLTASSAPSSVEMPRRRREDKSELRKSDLNKASSHPGVSHTGGEDRGRKSDEEVSDIRSRFSGLNNDKSKTEGAKSTGVARHPSRGKEFSQLLHKFSSSSEASSSERSDSESRQRRRVASFKRPLEREVSSSSDDAHSARNTPERTQSLKIVRPTLQEGGKEKEVGRSGSFKSDFMRKRFSPVPQGDAPSAELSQVLATHQVVERQHQVKVTEGEQTADRRQVHAEHLKSSAFEEMIADKEVASVLKAHREKSDLMKESHSDSQSGFSTIDQSLAVLARVTHELQEDKEHSPKTQRLRPPVRTSDSDKDRRESLEEVEQFISDVETRISSSLHLTDTSVSQKGLTDKTRKESSLSASVSVTSHAADEKRTADISTTSSVQVSEDRQARAGSKNRTVVADTFKSESRERSREHPNIVEKEQESTTVSVTVREEKEGSKEREKRDQSTEKETRTVTLPTSSAVSADAKSTCESASTSSTGIRRAESMKQPTSVTRSESFERRKGILKRSPSLPKQESKPTIDSQLFRIMEQRRQKQLEMAKEEPEEGQEPVVPTTHQRALSAAEEIEENIRCMREGKEGKEVAAQHSEEEAALCMPVAERIFKMQTKIKEKGDTPVTPKQESKPTIDSQLFRIVEQRRQKELEMAKEEPEEGQKPVVPATRQRALSAAEEIEENVRYMREGKEGKEGAAQYSEEEAALCMPVAERIFKMQTKIEEKRHTPVTPKSRSGAATPKSARSWSSSITPCKQLSVDEGVAEVTAQGPTFTTSTITTGDSISSNTKTEATIEEEVSGLQLMERLTTLAASNAQFQERRHKFQKRPREDWRTRTQPITLDEIHEADSLDTVSAFRALVRRNASKSMFDQLKTQEQHRPLPVKGTEFPQHLTPNKRGRRTRVQRHKTLPVTAEELNAIPEGELMEPVPLRDTHELWKRDSRTDSGILSGSDMDSLGSDSLRSLTLEMDVADNDPSRLSVSSKTSLFRSLDDRARQEREKEKSASGAKRYIDRKKRERSRTQPVTDDEVKTAAEMSDEKKPTPVKIPQPEVVNRPKAPSVDLEEEEEKDDQLIKLSLAEKVKLFSQKQKEEKEAAAKPPPRADAPVPKRRQRKLNSRFNTQPVTPEELEKASKISPLAMSLVKPPDPELLMGLKLKDQQELMMLHAEATLTKCSSRPSSQPGSRRGSVNAPDAPASADQDEARHDVSDKERTSTTTTTSNTADSNKQAVSSSHSDLPRTDSEPRSILKKTKSTESVPTDLKHAPSNQVPLASEPPTQVPQDLKNEEEERDCASPVPEMVLLSGVGGEEEEESTDISFYLADEDLAGESTTDTAVTEEAAIRTPDSRRRSRGADRKAQAERYLTQPAPQLTPERSPQTKRKYEGRHMTQPITPDEMKEAEYSTTPSSKSGGSIADRLNQLKTSGEENWKKRVTKDKELTTPVTDVKWREKSGLAAVRPASISDRLNKLEVSSEQWKERVEDTDAKTFTVANKITKALVSSESPLVAKIRASSKKDLTRLDDSSNASSPVNSPSTPTKEFLPKVPLPKEIIADPEAVKNAEKKEKHKVELRGVDSGEEEKGETVRVEVPRVDEAEIEQFFSTKEITEITDKVDMDVDDFDNIFIESNEILQSVKKIRPTRRKKATSRNPLKTVSQFVEIQTEYIQVSTGAAEKHLRKMKTEGLKRDAGFALEALAGLASKENFSKVELRKTEPSSLPASLAARRNPFTDLMLLHIKGRRNTQTRLVEPSSKSMNAGDCYILVAPDKVINWVGEYSNIIEKAKAAEVASFIQQKRDLGYKSTAAVQIVDQAKDHLGPGKHFWAALKGEKECQACGPDEEDELYESSITKTNMVYRLVDGALQPYEKYWGAIPKHAMLDKKEVLVFDFGSEFYVWQGKEVSSSQRKQGMSLAQKLWEKGYDYSQCAVSPMAPLRSEEDGGIPVQASQRPDWVIFGKVNQNMETILFREKFADWPDTSRLIGVKRDKTAEVKYDFADIKAYDAKKMIPVNNLPVTLLLEGAHVGRGKKWQEDMQGFIKEQDILTLGTKVWHVMEYEHYQMPENSYGQFHRGDTYVVRWQYMITNAGLKSLKGQAARHSLTGRERCAYFFWQGQDSTINEKGASALMTVELDEERGPQVRVVQGKEPPCFLNLFEGSMIVHVGKREDACTNTEGPWRLYCLRGDEAGELCLLEIPVSVANLRSCSSMVLLNTRTGITYIWHGVKSPKHKRQLAVTAVQNMKEKRPLELDLHEDAHIIVTEVEEGEEKAEIWLALDSKDRSLYHSLLTEPARYDYTPRLFHMTSVSMVFEVIEQMNPARLPGVTTPFPFFQSDLYKASQPALFLLDVGRCVYLWQGWWPVGDEEMENVHTGSAAARYNVDRRCAMETTLNYCKERGSAGRTPEAFLVCAGVEPLAFQNLFPFWEVDSTVHSLAVLDGKREGYCEPVEDVYIKLTQTRYTLEELQERPLPDGVDPLKLESYLADEEFEDVLEMKRDEFYALPTWRQGQIKQSVGLF